MELLVHCLIHPKCLAQHGVSEQNIVKLVQDLVDSVIQSVQSVTPNVDVRIFRLFNELENGVGLAVYIPSGPRQWLQ